MKRNINHFRKSNLINFQLIRKVAATKNKLIAHEGYRFLFTSWLLFVAFLLCGLKLWSQVPVKKYRFLRLVSALILELITGQLPITPRCLISPKSFGNL